MLRRPAIALFVLTAGVYAYFYQAGGWNQNSRFDLTRAVVEHGTLSIDLYRTNTGDESKRLGHYFCDKAPGLSFLSIPAYAAVHAIRGTPPPKSPWLDAAAYFVTLSVVALPSAAGVVAFWLLLGAFALGWRTRAGLTLAYALGTLALPYSTLLYGHQPIAALLVGAFALLARGRPMAGAEPMTPLGQKRLMAVGALLGVAVAVEYPAALAAVVLGVYAATFVRPWYRLGWIALGALPAAAALAAYHAAAFGGPMVLPYSFSTQPHRHMGWFMGLGAPRWDIFVQLFVGTYRGLFYGSSWLAVALAGLAWLVRGARRREAFAALAIVLLFVWLNDSLVDWDGGWAMGPRYLVPVLPFFALFAAGIPTGTRVGKALWAVLGVLAIVSTALMLLGTAVKPEVPMYVARPFENFLWPAFRTGRLAINTQGIDSVSAPVHVPPRAWNLGQQMGLRGFWSLAPLAAWALLAGTWFVRTARNPD